MAEGQPALCTLTSFDQGLTLQVPSLRVTVTLPDGRVIAAPLGMRPFVVGTSPECHLTVTDPRVSRRHCELRLMERGVLLRDLGSKNGTLLQSMPILEALLPFSLPVTIGNSQLVLQPAGTASVVPLSSRMKFGDALGQSLAARALFAKLERVAPTDETVLLLGESGTGKEVLAKAIHAQSRRKDKPFITVDCSAIAPNLIEGELFGHVRGAFTGAATTQGGLLESADGGTLFIDEIGELPIEIQPKLLRALESRQVRKLGSGEWRDFDARVIAATHRNLQARVKEGTFREDLYYRLAVVEVHVPALRERKDDIPMLVERFLTMRDPPHTLSDLPESTLALLQAHDWPGNVRELRNTVARIMLFPELIHDLIGARRTGATPGTPKPAPTQPPPPPASPATAADLEAERLGQLLELPLPEARDVLIEQFERGYISTKLRQHKGNVTHAADAMGVSRQHVHRLIERYGLKGK